MSDLRVGLVPLGPGRRVEWSETVDTEGSLL